MFSGILTTISTAILLVIEKTGYFGIFLLMLFQSANIPVPSEITMPFAGFLVSRGRFVFSAVVLAGALGNLAGAYLSYGLAGRLLVSGWRDRSRVLKILISDRNLALANKWFGRYGAFSVFFGRLVPVVSTFISFPAGLAKMNRTLFLALTLAGSLLWSFVLTRLGVALGDNWFAVKSFLAGFEEVILGVLALLAIYFLWRHLWPQKQAK